MMDDAFLDSSDEIASTIAEWFLMCPLADIRAKKLCQAL